VCPNWGQSNVIGCKVKEIPMSNVKVIGLPGSNFVWAVRIALAEKGVEHESISAPPHSPAVSNVHPLGKIPVFHHGEVALCESRAIIDYVDRSFAGSPLVPTDVEAALRSEVWTAIVSMSLEPLLIRQFVFAHIFPASHDGQPDDAFIATLAPKVEGALDVVEEALVRGHIGQDGFGRVDAYLVPILFYLRTTPSGGDMIVGRAGVSQYLERGLARPSVQATMPPAPEKPDAGSAV
jgi:glutathione S-transferase